MRHTLYGTMVAAVLIFAPYRAAADLTLTVPDDIAESGLWDYALPRFTLKTRVRVDLGPDGAVRIEARGDGRPVFTAAGVTYTMTATDDDAAERFADWLTSDIGRRTIESYSPETGPAFTAADVVATRSAAATFDGDAVEGAELSLTLCGRCHVVGEVNRMNSIGSTPSFGVLRTFPDWSGRFQAFFALNPHGAFTQVEGVTPPFPIDRPSPIAPVEMTLDDLDAILAYVAAMEPADLGAPIQHQ